MKKKSHLITKKGDSGMSLLLTGESFSKCAVQFDAMGDCDELVSFLGIARQHARKKFIKKALESIQNHIFIAGSEIASHQSKAPQLKERISERCVAQMTRDCEILMKKLRIPSRFVIPGETISSAYLDYARALARRCERRVVLLDQQGLICNKNLIVWFNRLSDYLYLLARAEGKN